MRPPSLRPHAILLPRGTRLHVVECPPLQPGLPVVWCPTLVACALVPLLRRANYARPFLSVLDRLLGEFGARRRRRSDNAFLVLCDCGHVVRRLFLTPEGRWGCRHCQRVPEVAFVLDAARLLFGLRIGLRGIVATRLHLRLVRRLVGRMPRYVPNQMTVVMAATVVASYEPRCREKPWKPGPLMRAVADEMLAAWLEGWASPVAYAARCRAELGG